MADNTTINSMSGGDTIATDDISGVKYQRVKMALGDDGVNDGDVSSTNPMPVTDTTTGAVIDESTANLADAATYTTSSWVDVSRYGCVAARVYASHNGTYSVLFSADGSTTHSTVGPYTYDTTKIFTPKFLGVGAKYAKITFTNNSGSAQTDFHIQLIASVTDKIIKIGQNRTVPKDVDSIPVRSLPNWLDLVSGKYEGVSVVSKFGRNTSVGVSYVPVAQGGIYRTVQTGSATTLRVKAGNANDTAAGSGARAVTLEFIDTNGDIVQETLATSGTSASSPTSASAIRLLRFWVSSSGTYATSSAGSHAGDIVIENSAGGTDWGTISSSNFPLGQSEIGAYTIPTGKIGYVFLDGISCNSTKTTDLAFFFRANILETAAPFTPMRVQRVITGITTNTVRLQKDLPIGAYTGPCDVGYMAKVNTGTAEVSLDFDIVLVDA